MDIVIDLLLIQFIIVNIIDVSGFIQEMEGILSKWLKIRAKRTLDQVPNTQETSVPDSTQKVQKVIKAQSTYTKVSIPKPFSCSYCLTFWFGLFYLLYTGITLPYVAVLMILCALTTVTGEMMYLVKDILTKIIITINDWIQ